MAEVHIQTVAIPEQWMKVVEICGSICGINELYGFAGDDRETIDKIREDRKIVSPIQIAGVRIGLNSRSINHGEYGEKHLDWVTLGDGEFFSIRVGNNDASNFSDQIFFHRLGPEIYIGISSTPTKDVY